MPQKACERCIFHVRPYAYLFEMPQNRRLSFSAHFFIFKLVFFFEMPRFFMFEFFEMSHFSHFQNEKGTIGHFEKFELKNRGISKKKHVTS